MNTNQLKFLFDLLKSIDDSLKKLVKKKAKRNKHKPPAPTYMDK